ncbi:MAG: PhzF family phenazine biosynthesis protein [Gaiellaceae bacterium]
MTAELHVLEVFVGPDGCGGNPLGVFLGGRAIRERQAVAMRLGFSETVFVDDPRTGVLHIFTPAREVRFAGHPLVGTGWLLASGQSTITRALRPPAGDVPHWIDGQSRSWIRGRPEWAPEMELRQLDGPAAVDALDGPPEGVAFLDAWAWLDEEAGAVRSRVFAPVLGIAEDEATGAAAVRLAAALGRPIDIYQGVGSLIHACPVRTGAVEIGGLVRLVEVRDEPTN